MEALLNGQVLDEDHWSIDGPSECLVPAGRPGPFRMSTRSAAAVDRLTGAVERHATACIEFVHGAGLWTVVSFADDEQQERWNGPVRAAFRLLADSGFGGERGRGWGRSEAPEFIEGSAAGHDPTAARERSREPEPAAEAAESAPRNPRTQTPPVRSRPSANAGPRRAAGSITGSFPVHARPPTIPSTGRRAPTAWWPRGGRIDSPVRQGDLKKQLK